ncbi:FMN-dependent alpha-hydroxy acid dehydrogenase [Pisolithus sp. B1]|nr:FMN-dependent alpha-hydroxy acid dehydrogenase [Pisolithus sp. B1]
MTAKNPPPNKWTNYLVDIYVQGRPPVLGTVSIKDIEEKAKEAMKNHIAAYMYTFGSAGTCSTDLANKRAFENYKLVPRMLVDVSNRNIETTIFGVTYPSPLLVAPIGVQGVLHPDADLATASAASNSSRSIEDVAKASGPHGHTWYQLYWPRTAELTLRTGSLLLVITLDTMLLGWRPHDLETAYLPFAYGVGIQVGTSDPVFMQRFNLPPRENERTRFPFEPEKIRRAALEQGDEEALRSLSLGKEWVAELNSGVFRTWDDLKFIKENWEGPDAEKAIAHGIDGIVVSNHGGRQIDGAIGSLDALDDIMKSRKVRAAQKSGKLTVLFDSGVRTGSDVVKALAMGAQGVLIGRPIMYGLAIAGQEGVEQILLQTICEMHITLGLCGYGSVNEIIGKKDEVLANLQYKL